MTYKHRFFYILILILTSFNLSGCGLLSLFGIAGFALFSSSDDKNSSSPGLVGNPVEEPQPMATCVSNSTRNLVDGNLTAEPPAFLNSSLGGRRDLTFGNQGNALATFSNNGQFLSTISLNSRGQILEVGHILNDQDADALISRTNSNGAIDLQFAGKGWISLDLQGNEFATSVIQYGDGSFIVGGYSTKIVNQKGTSEIFLARYFSNGTLDTSFGNSGVVKTSITGQQDFLTSAMVLPDCHIAIAGYSQNGSQSRALVARFNPNGEIDRNFGNGGYQLFGDTNTSNEIISALGTTQDGKIYLAGYTNRGTHTDFFLIRTNADGQLDTSFGTQGKVRTDLGSNRDERATSLFISPSGNILLGGVTQNTDSQDIALAKYLPSGELDLTFGNNGLKVIDFSQTGVPSHEELTDLLVSRSGAIHVVGYLRRGVAQGQNLFTTRLLSNGTIDTNWGTSGLIDLDIQTNDDFAKSAVLSEEGALFVGSTTYEPNEATYSFALTKIEF